MMQDRIMIFVFFFNDTATTEIYTLSLHDALPISPPERLTEGLFDAALDLRRRGEWNAHDVVNWKSLDRKSTRLNSSHANISYAVFCLKKKKKQKSIINNINYC